MKDFFDRFKDRHTHKIPAEKLTDFHGEYAKMFKFKVPLHPKNLSQLVHPFHGYMTAFRGQAFTFDELVAVYENQIAASFEKTFGRELLGDELSCLSFWLIQDEARKGWLTLEELKGLLYAFKFSHLFVDQYGKPDDVLTLQKLRREFKFNLSGKPGELLLPAKDSAEANDVDSHVIVRFDFLRDVFLERGL